MRDRHAYTRYRPGVDIKEAYLHLRKAGMPVEKVEQDSQMNSWKITAAWVESGQRHTFQYRVAEELLAQHPELALDEILKRYAKERKAMAVNFVPNGGYSITSGSGTAWNGLQTTSINTAGQFVTPGEWYETQRTYTREDYLKKQEEARQAAALLEATEALRLQREEEAAIKSIAETMKKRAS